MKVNLLTNNYIQNYSNTKQSPVFQACGNPINLKYIMEKRDYLLPQRVKEQVGKIMERNPKNMPSLLEVHNSVYAPLAECKSFDEVKKLFPEFSGIKEQVVYERNSVYSRNFQNRTDENFALDVLKKFWVELKTKDEIAQDFGMPNRSSLEWILKKINFVSYPLNYKTLLKSSDSTGNAKIAAKTTAWNSMHPDLMRAHNKRAAQGCKTPEYRQTQSARIIALDSQNPQRREKISKYTKRVWELCPEVKHAMSEFSKEAPSFIIACVSKKLRGENLNALESRMCKAFFSRFWRLNPEMRETYARARAIASMELHANKLS